MTTAQTIGAAIRREREAQRLDRHAFAARAGLCERTVRRVEDGTSLCAATIDALVDALDVVLIVSLDR